MRTRLLVCVLAGWIGVTVLHAQEQKPTITPGGAPVAQVPGSLPAPSKESTPAVVTTTIPSPAAPPHWPEQIMWAAGMSYLMQLLKKTKYFPLLTPETDAKIQGLLGFLVAAGTAAGIHIAVQGSVLDNSGLSFSVTGLTIGAFKDVAFQWLAQQIAYDKIVKDAKP